MPEISDSDYRLFVRYQTIGTPEEITKKRDELEKDNKAQRDKITETSAKVPAVDALVLTGEEAKAYPAWKDAVGTRKPEDLRTELEMGAKAASRLKDVEWERATEAAAKTLGWNGEALSRLPGAKDHLFEVKTEDVGGKTIEVAYVTAPGENQQAKKLEDYAPQVTDWKPLMSAVAVKQDAASGRTATAFPRQAAAGASPRTAATPEDHRLSVRSKVDYSL